MFDTLYVLIVVIGTVGGGIDVSFQEFNSKINCTLAQDHVLRTKPDRNRYFYIHTTCVLK